MEEYKFKLSNYSFIMILCINRLNNLKFDTLRKRLSKCFRV